jgi:alpha-L-arabinofuranosidase
LLVQGDKLVRTPTFYVFKMYKVHQDNTLLPINVKCEEYTVNGEKLPGVSASASKDAAGKIFLSICNLSPARPMDIDVELRGVNEMTKVNGGIITASSMTDYNDFGKPEKIAISSFSGFKSSKNLLKLSLPGKSVVTLEIE